MTLLQLLSALQYHQHMKIYEKYGKKTKLIYSGFAGDIKINAISKYVDKIEIKHFKRLVITIH